ncbi:MAG: HYR domain-containing protein [Phycisphaerae bacterium]|nr:HYR domain-containing protein [Saprospiraceae bacterium]
MQKLKHSRLLPITGLLLGMLVWLANNGNPPTGRTAAPFDGNCNSCHTGGGFNGNIDVTGFPVTADPDALYDINVKMTVTAGSPSKAGLQLVVVDANNANCGNLIEAAADLGTEFLAGREYVEHRNGKNIAGGMVSWDFQWRAPFSVPGNTVKVYYIVNLCNGNGGSGGDEPVWENFSFGFAGPPPLIATITNTVNPTCNGGNNGSATVEATGGTPPYTYAWTGGQTTQTAINLTAGTYTVSVTSAGGGSPATASTTLTQPSVMTLSTSVMGSVTCITSATATATAGGGTPGYTYLWSDGQTDKTATFDQTGTYTIIATDANGCTKASSAIITGNTILPIANAGPSGVITCTTPQLQLNGAGSSTGGNITYLWTASNGGNIVSGSTTLTPTVNACGTYAIKVTNTTNGCTATASTTVTCNTAPPNASASGGTITCATPDVMLMGNSTTPGATFRWTGPGITPGNQDQQKPVVNVTGTYTLTVTDPDNGCTKTATATVTGDTAAPTALGSVSGSLTCLVTSVQLNLTTNAPNPIFGWTGPNNFSSNIANPSVSIPGNYFGTVTNTINGCKGFDTITVQQNITPPAASASVSGQLNCINDTIQLLGNSPLAPNVTYSWTGQNFSSNLQNPLTDTAGTYTLTVKGNVNGCTSSAVATVVQNTTAPFDSIVKPGNLNCNNSSLQLNGTPSSQGPPFDYLWTVKNGGHIVSGDTTLTPVVDSIGKYFLTVINIDNGCTAVDSVEVHQSLPVTAAITASSNVSCNGGNNGSATASGGGGNGIFSFNWSNGDTIPTTTGLTAGTYIVSVTDGENCTASATIVITQPAPLLANASATGETANNANNGTATANPTGGTAGYTYNWSNGGTTKTITNLAPGSYTVLVTDAKGCTAVQTVTVNAFGCSLQGAVSATNVTCNGANNGTATVTLTGAANPIAYLWSNGATTQSVNNLAPGTYTVGILDGNNCPAVFSTSIGEPPALSANASATGVTSNGASDGTATANPTGGTPNYTYVWSNSATTQTITGLAPGSYTVVVTDSKGCSSQQTVNVSAFNCALSATVSSANVLCFGGADGQATIAVSGGALPYTYLWSNGSTTQTATNLAAGNYTVSATDAAGCSVAQSVGITQPAQLVATLLAVQNVLCPHDMNGGAQIAATGGTPPYTFSVPGNNGNLGVGSYTVSVTDANGCTSTVSFNIIATDIQGPTLACPSNIQVCGANEVNYPTATAQDNCGLVGPITVTGPPSGSIFPVGIAIIQFQAADFSGNTGTCSFSIVVHNLPSVSIDNVSNDMNGQGVGAISITVEGNGGFSFAWSKDGQTFSTAEDLIGLNAGSYSLIVTDFNGCTSILTPITITNTVGTSEPGRVGSVRLWPNPAQSAIQLEIIDLDVIAACIVDMRGGLVQEIQPSEFSGEIDIHLLPEGVYCLKISAMNGRVMSLKFVKQ